MRAAASPKARRTKNEATSPEPGRAVTATDMELLYTHSSNRVRLITYSDLPQRGTRRRPHISRSRTKDAREKASRARDHSQPRRNPGCRTGRKLFLPPRLTATSRALFESNLTLSSAASPQPGSFPTFERRPALAPSPTDLFSGAARTKCLLARIKASRVPNLLASLQAPAGVRQESSTHLERPRCGGLDCQLALSERLSGRGWSGQRFLPRP